MRRTVIRLALAEFLVCIVAMANDQLYLITGSPSPKTNALYPSKLLELESDGSVKTLSRLAEGTEWITVSYDLRVAVIFPKGPDNVIRVLDLRNGTVAKSCPDPPAPIGGLMDQWLIDSPSAGPVFVEYLVGDDISKGVLRGMALSAQTPCEKSFSSIDPTDVRFISAHGWAGVADLAVSDGLQVAVREDGALSAWISGITSYLGPKIPVELLVDFKRPFGAVMINDSHLLAVALGDGANASKEGLFLLRRRDHVWFQVPVPSEKVVWVRGFGDVIALAEAQTKNSRHAVSAGAAEWRKSGGIGPAFAHGPVFDRTVFPGRLHLYDVERKKSYLIETQQGDSEVLLVEGQTVYYRISDRIYKAEMMDSGMSPAKLLATDEAIRDAHWAFIKH